MQSEDYNKLSKNNKGDKDKLHQNMQNNDEWMNEWMNEWMKCYFVQFFCDFHIFLEDFCIRD